jgi:structural maintenance of chromosome 2
MYNRIPDHAIAAAERIAAKYNAKIYRPWDEHISRPVDRNLESVHRYCLGTFLICDNMDAAAEISVSRDVQTVVITIAGESFEPSGEMSGGFRGEQSSPFRKWHSYQRLVAETRKRNENDDDKNDLEEKLNKRKAERDGLLQKREYLGRLAEKLDKVRGRLQDIKGRLTLDASSKYQTQLPIYLNKLKQDQEEYDRLQNQIKSTESMLKQIQTGGTDVKSMFKDKILQIQEEEKKLKRDYGQASSTYAENEALISTEHNEIEKIKETIKDEEKKIDRLSLLLEERSNFFSAETFKLESKQRELEDYQVKLKEANEREITRKQQHEDLNEKIKKTEEDISQVNSQIKNLTGDIADANSKLAKNPDLKNMPFVEDKELEAVDIRKKESEHKSIATKFYDLQKQVNKEAESIRSRLEEQMQDLIKKEKILKEDKALIYMNLDQLDEKSQKSVMECFEFVNK